ncbi:protein CHROMATIN REMODELING 24-like [Rutidosis leptorrhynchoides]|uniref:protein CHROMATIN REMODELING 24-like n=1 Tax=Rutidosis leptorrhynchoides TaxID=125765 RepID=UPI003A9A1926
MPDESSNKAMSLNQLHNRFIAASQYKSTPCSFQSEMKNRDRQEDDDAPSFNFDFDSPSPPKTLISTIEQADDDDAQSDTIGLPHSSAEDKLSSEVMKKVEVLTGQEDENSDVDDIDTHHEEKMPSKGMNKQEVSTAQETESSDVDDIDTHHEEDHQKVMLQGRRRLCKVVVKDDGEEDGRFNDFVSDIADELSEFDSPSPVKNTGNNNEGGDEIRDILSNLSSKFEILSIEKGKRPTKQLSSSYKDVDFKPSPFPVASNQSGISLKAAATRKEDFNGGYVKSHVGKVVSNESSIRPPKYETYEDDDDDDCVVTSGQKFVQKVESRNGKSILESDVSNNVYTLKDERSDPVLGDEASFSLSNPKFNFSLPSKIATMLYPHQREGLKWLWSLHCKGKGGILGDDMGLGKTMQICGFLAGLFHSRLIKRVLVVAPKTLLPHWMKELGVVGLSRKTREYFGTCAKAREYELQYILQDKGVLLTTYDIVRNNVKSLSGDYDEMDEDSVTWDYMILDEGHLIKNPSTQRAKSLLAIPCAHRIIISGTPLQNNLKELWALFNFCCPELLGDKKCFKDKYEAAILRGNDKKASDRDKRIGSAVAQDLRKCIHPYFLRRLKSEVFGEDGGTNAAKLSKKHEIIVWLKLSNVQRQLYEAFLKSEIVLSAFDGSPLAAITILKKICDHPLLLTKRAAEDVLEGMESVLNQDDHGVAEKLVMNIADVADRFDIGEHNDNLSCKISFIVSLLDKLIPEGHNVLIFSQTRKMLNLIQDVLNTRGYKFLRIDGTTKASDRLKIVDDFQEGVGAPIFLLTSQVGGLGLTLTKADRVIVVDPAWNPSTDNQSVDRAYRIGQKKDVIVYRLMTCGTVEEKIYRKQVYKGGLFRSATEQKDQTRYFSAQDLRELLSLPKHGFDISLTQQQMYEEHDSEHQMDSSLKVHTKFLESLGIAGISHHSLLFSKTAPVPAVSDEELARIRQSTYVSNSSTYVGSSSSYSSREPNVDAARFAFNPKENVAQRKNISPSISNKLTESEIKQQINRLSQLYANKAMVARLGDNGEKIRKQIAELNSELHKLCMPKRVETDIIDLDDVADDFNRVLNV